MQRSGNVIAGSVYLSDLFVLRSDLSFRKAKN